MFGASDAARLARPLVGDGATVTHEGAGWDHVAWRVEGRDGSPWIVRAASLDDEDDTDVGDVRREVAVMQLVRRTLRARGDRRELVADAVVLDEALGCMAHPRVPGMPLQDLLAAGAVPVGQIHRLATEIGALIAAIASIDPSGAVEPIPRDDDSFDEWFAALPALAATVAHLLSTDERAAIARFVASPVPPPPAPDELVLTHNDLGGEHVLVDPTSLAITGIIDWSDAAIADPAAELGRLLRDLGATHLDAVLDGMGATGPRRSGLVTRGWCYARCLVVEDLAYAVRKRPDLVTFEHASLGRLFDGV